MTASRARLLHIFRKSWNVNSKRIVEKVVPPCRACQTRTLSTSVITRANKILGRYPVSPLRLRNWIYISGNEYATGSKGAKVKDIDVFEESLTPEETEKVLKLVNEVQQSEDLLKYIIPKKKAEELIKRRNESDKLFTSLDQLSVIIGPKVKKRSNVCEKFEWLKVIIQMYLFYFVAEFVEILLQRIKQTNSCKYECSNVSACKRRGSNSIFQSIKYNCSRR